MPEYRLTRTAGIASNLGFRSYTRDLDIWSLAGGGFIVSTGTAFTGSPATFYSSLRLFDAAGNFVRQFSISDGSLNVEAENPRVVSFADGGFAVYRINPGRFNQPPGDVIATFYNADGTVRAAERVINALPDSASAVVQSSPIAVQLDGGNVVFAWREGGGAAFQRFDVSGNKIGGMTTLSAGQALGDVVAVNGGGFAIVWRTQTGAGVYAFEGQIFDANGVAGALFTVATETSTVAFVPIVVDLPNGGFIVVWKDGDRIEAQRISDTGARIGDQVVLATVPGNFDITALKAGGLAISWQDGNNHFVRAVGETGAPLSSTVLVNPGSTSAPLDVNLVELTDGTLEVSWYDSQVRIAKVEVITTPPATTFTGSNIDETIYGDPTLGSVLNGRDGADTLIGGAGDDLLNGGAGGDLMNGGAGTDTVTYADAAGTGVFVDLGGGLGSDAFANGDRYVGIENVVGSGFADRIYGDAGVNRLEGGGGDDTLGGGLGADTLIGGAGSDTVTYAENAGAVFIDLRVGRGYGNAAQGDTYDSIENVVGTIFADTLIGDAGANRLDGGDGNDTLIGGLGADVLVGGNGVDFASYEDNLGAVFVDLRIRQGFGNAAQGDTYEGIDNLRGSQFNDYLIGDTNINVLEGGAGDDVLIGGLGGDVLVGGTGTDTASYEDNLGAVTANLLEGRGFGNAAQGDTYTSIENVTGSHFADTLIGDGGANRLDGSFGDDVLIGGLGADVLVGGDGIDTASYADNWGAVNVSLVTGGLGNAAQGDTYSSIENLIGSGFGDLLAGDGGANRIDGGQGNDTLTGGAGNDSFAFTTALSASSNLDHITDFTSGSDRIVLSSAIFGISPGSLPPNAFLVGPVATGGGNRIVYDPATGTLYYDPDGFGTDPAIAFAVLDTKPTLTQADFVVI